MAILHDAASNVAEGTTDRSWTHTPVGTPAGVLVLILAIGPADTDVINGVTYGGVAMTEVSGSPVFQASSHCYGYFLNTNIPTGAQTVVVDGSDASPKRAVAITVTCTAPRIAVIGGTTADTHTSGDSHSVAAIPVNAGFSAFIYGVMEHDNEVANVTPGTGMTQILEYDPAASLDTASWIRSTSAMAANTGQLRWTTATNANHAILGVALIEGPDQSATANGIASAEVFGSPVVEHAALNLTATGIPSEEAIGTPDVEGGSPTAISIPSEEAMGEPRVLADPGAAPLEIEPPSSIAAELRLDPAAIGFEPFQATNGPNFPSAAVEEATSGTEPWTGETNVFTSNDVRATTTLGGVSAGDDSHVTSVHSPDDDVGSVGLWNVSFPGDTSTINDDGATTKSGLSAFQVSDYLICTDYDFSIPSDATITGIEVQVRRRKYPGISGTSVADNTIVLLQGGNVGGSNRAVTGTNWPTSFSTRTYGGNGDLWGRSWSPSQINSATGFGVGLRAVGTGTSGSVPEVDHIGVKVYYTTPDPTNFDTSSERLKVTGFGHSLPAGAEVTGASFTVECSGNTGGPTGEVIIYDDSIRLIKAGVATGDDKWSGSSWPDVSDGFRTYGGPGDLWGTTLTKADVENSGFGIGIEAAGRGSARVDSVTSSVHYTVPGQEVQVSGARTIRFSPDEDEIGQVPKSLTFTTEIPGGFSGATMSVPTPEFFDAQEYLYATARVYEYETNRTIYEGRVVGVSDTADETNFEMEGWAKHLEDDNSAREIFLDRDLSHWEGVSAAMRFEYSDTDVITDGSVTSDPETGAPGIKLALGSSETNKPWAVSMYRSGGIPIDKVDYAWRRGPDVSAADTGYTWWVDMTEFDVFVGDWAGTANLRASGPGAGTLDASDALDLYYVLVNFSYNTFWAGWSEEYFVLWTMACVIGKHGLPLQGSVSAPNNGRGIRVSDMVPYILSTWAPLLVKGDIEATTFAVPHAVFLEPTTAMAMIESLVLFGGTTGRILDWWVYDDRTFGMGSPGNYGSVWRTRYEEDAATANGQGPDAQRMINGVVVEYDAGDGQTKTVGPPGARVDSQQLTLQDLSDSNPCNRTGARHWEVYNAGVTTQAGAILIGQLILAERNRQEWRGDITIPGRVRDSYGNWVPVFMVRAGDHIIIEDDADTRQRRIISTSYSAEDDAVTLSVGAPPDRLDVLLARAGVVLVGKV